MNRRQSLVLPDAAATQSLGAALARACKAACVIYLEGDLGTGKTTLVRGFLRARGHAGRVKSPSFSLLECYDTPGGRVFHLDLYRLTDPGETAYLGLDDFEPGADWLLVEWPGHGAGWLPVADVRVRLAFEGAGRRVGLAAHGAWGRCLEAALNSIKSIKDKDL